MSKKLLLLLACTAFVGVACSSKDKKSENSLAIKDDAKVEVQEKSVDKLAYGCVVGKDLRIVKVAQKPGRCEVFYTKFKETGQVAWAEATPAICSRVFDQIRTNIESKGFKCDADVSKLENEMDSKHSKVSLSKGKKSS